MAQGDGHRVPEQRDGHAAPAHVAALSHTGLRRAAEDFFTGQVDALGGDATAPVLLAYLRGTFHSVLTTGVEDALTPLELGRAARTVLLLARSCADQCSFAASRRRLGRAAALAELAGEPSTRAIALRLLSQAALDQNQPAVGLSSVRQALEVSPGTPAMVQAFVAAQAAHVHAALGQRAPALTWLATADRLQGGVRPDSDPFHTYRPAALHFKRAVVLGLLGDHEAAHAALDASLAARPAQQERAIMLTRVERARVYRLAGRAAEAAAELRRAQALNRGSTRPRPPARSRAWEAPEHPASGSRPAACPEGPAARSPPRRKHTPPARSERGPCAARLSLRPLAAPGRDRAEYGV
ncbi:hypothetical protein [Streptomyces antarcticus]|uniref:hypothetical protein n=1 Tax=Streptomyces antarcticus TaxID=2996458 RepID=UPI002271C84C|nr:MULTISPECIES: hypothetical protein [unclassified Streptomyces]MCY0943781.1 hypothetical protein [Streptomyces sp. H34-AA3]MCZ4086712.1 hypothetical protein [Streptomyces sp. H34-S5]